MKTALLKHDEMDYESDNEDHATMVISYAEQRLIWSIRPPPPMSQKQQQTNAEVL